MKRFLISTALFVSLLILPGCMEGVIATETVVDTKTAISNAVASMTSVETAITLDMQAYAGSVDTSDAHSASIGSDITIQMTADPLAVHAECFSRVLVDGVATRDDREYYIVSEDNGMGKYLYIEETGQWEHTELTVAETMAVPAQTGLIYDWTSFLSYLEDENYTEPMEGKTCLRLSGEVPANLLQQLFVDGNVFGDFMYNTEMLLNDRIHCVLFVDSETYQPVRIDLSLAESFYVYDMAFDVAEVVVTYSRWNEISAIDIPKKIEIVATNPDYDFYSNYYVWNLFMPYVTKGTTSDTGANENTDVGFTADWKTFQVRIDGGMTQLPLQPIDLLKLGYTLDPAYESVLVEPNQYVENIPLQKGIDTILCTFYNPDTVAQFVSNCLIGGIDLSYVDTPNLSIQLYLPGEVALGISREALVSAYGDPDSLITAFASDTYTWYGNEDNEYFVAEVSTASNAVIRLSLQCVPVTGGEQ